MANTNPTKNSNPLKSPPQSSDPTGNANPLKDSSAGSSNNTHGQQKQSKFKKYLRELANPIGFMLGCSSVAVLIAKSDDVIEYLENNNVFEVMEDYNENLRDRLNDIGDYLVPPKPAPWLLDFETLKYPANLPTLVLDLDKVLCKLVYDRHSGWQVLKRPGAEQFLSELQHYFEIVVFSDDAFPVAADIIQRWNAPVVGVLHRDFCKRRRQNYIKDISKLGRNLDRVIHIDHDPVAVSLHPENAIVIKPFDGDMNDTELIDLIEFLKMTMHEPDTRKVLKRYGGDGDVGKRYMVEARDREELVNKRRSTMGGFGSRGHSGMGSGPGRVDPSGRRF